MAPKESNTNDGVARRESLTSHENELGEKSRFRAQKRNRYIVVARAFLIYHFHSKKKVKTEGSYCLLFLNFLFNNRMLTIHYQQNKSVCALHILQRYTRKI